MEFLKSLFSMCVSFFKSNTQDKSIDAELIEAFKLFFIDKDIEKLTARIIELLGSPITWANELSLDRLNYLIYISSKGKLLTIEDFVDVYGKILPTNIRIAFGLFK